MTGTAAGEDKGLLELLVVYSGGVVFAYEQALRDAPLRAGERRTLAGFRTRALEMDGALRRALAQAGGTRPPRRALTPASAHQSRDVYIKYVVKSEEALVSGWYAALRKLVDPRLLAGAAAYMAAGGRRLVVVRRLAGLPLVPRAFETGA